MATKTQKNSPEIVHTDMFKTESGRVWTRYWMRGPVVADDDLARVTQCVVRRMSTMLDGKRLLMDFVNGCVGFRFDAALVSASEAAMMEPAVRAVIADLAGSGNRAQVVSDGQGGWLMPSVTVRSKVGVQ
jgi:hypothetical protein